MIVLKLKYFRTLILLQFSCAKFNIQFDFLMFTTQVDRDFTTNVETHFTTQTFQIFMGVFLKNTINSNNVFFYVLFQSNY